MNNKSIVKEKNKLNYNYDLLKFQEACNGLTNLVVGMHDIKKQNIVYFSQSLKQVLGYQPEKMVNSGWKFWYSLINHTERPIVQQKISSILDLSIQHMRSRFGIKYHIRAAGGDWVYVKHEVRHKRFNGQLLILNMVHDNSEHELIDRYLGSSQQISQQPNLTKETIDISDREKQVLQLIACGLSSRQIAQKLYISRHTVISHRKNLIKKFEVKNTAELIKEASNVIEL